MGDVRLIQSQLFALYQQNRPAESLDFVLAFRRHSGLLVRTATSNPCPVPSVEDFSADTRNLW